MFDEEIIENSVDAEQVDVVDQPIEEAEEVSEPLAEPEPVEESVKEEVAKPQQTAEDNAKFAAVRREAEAKARDKVISELYGKSHNIHTYADYQEAVARENMQREIEELGDIPEDVAKEIVEARQFKKKLAEEAEQTRQYKEFMDTFPTIDVNTIPVEVFEMAAQGRDLTSAYALYQVKNLDKIKVQTEQETIKKIKQNVETSTGDLSGNQVQDDKMSVDQVNKLLESMGGKERSAWVDKNIDKLEKWGYFKNF